MHRRRSAYTVAVAAALAISAPLLTGCGSDSHAGSAAVVDGERITVSQVQDRAETVRKAQRADANSKELIEATGPLSLFSLNDMIRQRIVERAAKDEGIRVSRAEVQRFKKELEQQRGGPDQFREIMLKDATVAPSQLDDALRTDLLLTKLMQKMGVDPNSEQAQQAVFGKMAETAEKMGIKISPRFGEWNNERWTLDSTGEDEWIKPRVQQASQNGNAGQHSPDDGHDH